MFCRIINYKLFTSIDPHPLDDFKSLYQLVQSASVFRQMVIRVKKLEWLYDVAKDPSPTLSFFVAWIQVYVGFLLTSSLPLIGRKVSSSTKDVMRQKSVEREKSICQQAIKTKSLALRAIGKQENKSSLHGVYTTIHKLLCILSSAHFPFEIITENHMKINRFSLQHPVRWHCRIYRHLVHVLRSRFGENFERIVCTLRSFGGGELCFA